VSRVTVAVPARRTGLDDRRASSHGAMGVAASGLASRSARWRGRV